MPVSRFCVWGWRRQAGSLGPARAYRGWAAGLGSGTDSWVLCRWDSCKQGSFQHPHITGDDPGSVPREQAFYRLRLLTVSATLGGKKLVPPPPLSGEAGAQTRPLTSSLGCTRLGAGHRDLHPDTRPQPVCVTSILSKH